MHSLQAPIEWTAPISMGIERTSVDDLLAQHQKTIDRLLDVISPETRALETAFIDTVRQFVAWVHRLPASESHHHSYRGGLLEHSLEVALWSAQSARGRLGDRCQTGWDRRREERTYVLAIALGGLLHDLGKPVADLLVFDPSGQLRWNPYRDSLWGWAESMKIPTYHIQWLRGRGTRHRGFSLLMLRSVIQPLIFDRIREVGPELEASLLRALTQDAQEPDAFSAWVQRADQESAMRSLRDPRRQTEFGGPSPERILVHAMRHLIYEGIWCPNLPGNPLWYVEHQVYLVWPRAVDDLQPLIEKDRLSGVPLDPELLMGFMRDRGLLAPFETEDEIPSPLQTLRPQSLDMPLRVIQLRHPAMIFDGLPPESIGIFREYETATETGAPPQLGGESSTDGSIEGIPSGTILTKALETEGTTEPISLKQRLQAASERYEWMIREHHLFIPHPEAARALGMEPIALIEQLDQEDWLVPGGAGNIRKVRVLEGRRGLLLNRTVSSELLKAMKVPKRRSRRQGAISA